MSGKKKIAAAMMAVALPVAAVPSAQAPREAAPEAPRRGAATTARAPAIFSPKSLLLPYQRRWIEDPSRYKIGCMSRQTGKSFCTASEAVEDSLKNPGAKWVCMSAGERQALEWMEQARMWADAYRMPIERYAEDRQFAQALMKSAEISFGNGSRIVAIPANPSTARGYSANVILDEFAYHEDPDKIWAAMFPSQTNPLAGTFLQRVAAALAGESTDIRRELKLRVVSTFNGKGNKFFDLWEHAKDNGYSSHLVTIEDAVRDGLPINLAQLRAGFADDDAWQQEFMCVPADASNVLLPYDLIAQAESMEATEFCSPELFDAGASRELYAGVDFGRQTDPTVCWLVERVGDVLWTREVLVLKRMDVPEQQEILKLRLRNCRRVCFDYTGPGVGLGDFLARDYGEWKPAAHKFGRIELCTFSAGFKREIFPKLRRAFEAPVKLRVPVSREIREDLHAMQQQVRNGVYDYWAPRTREGHSDRCTAAALAIRAVGDGQHAVGIW